MQTKMIVKCMLKNLALGYGFGVKGNTRTKQESGETGQINNVTTIITPRGAFPEEERIVKASKKVINFFSKSPQWKDKLDHVMTAMDMPNMLSIIILKPKCGIL